MGRKMLPRVLKKCERKGCENTFIVKVGATYQKRYCSSRCAAIANSGKREKRSSRKFRLGCGTTTYVRDAYTLKDLQELPVNFASGSGGKFADVCNAILAGKFSFVGV